MTANELANSALAEERKRIEEEALKRSVLDAEAAAKFSTAAALDARDTLALPADIVNQKLLAAKEREPSPAGGGGDGGHAAKESPAPSPRAAPADASPFNQPKPGSQDAGKESSVPATSPIPAAAAIDWKTVKAQAVEAHKDSTNLDMFDSGLAPSDSAKELSPGLDLPVAAELGKTFRPALDSSLLRPNVWNKGLIIPGTGEFKLLADAIAGGYDLGILLDKTKKLEVRGRLSFAKLSHFLKELHLSKHRSAMLGVLRPSPSNTPAEIEKIKSMIAGYASADRCGVAEPYKGVEVYLVPPSPLARRILEAGKEAEPDHAIGSAVIRGGDDATFLQDDNMVVIAVYKKDAVLPPAVPYISYEEPSLIPSGHGMFGPIPMQPAAAGPSPYPPTVPMMPAQPQPIPMQPAVAPAAPVQAPQLDFNALSQLAAMMGVPPAPQDPNRQ